MFAVLYRASVYPAREEEYQRLWHQVATFFVQHRGALGSCLHKTKQGEWIAYSRWPDKTTRDASWPQENEEPSETLSSEIQGAITELKNCIDKDQPYEEICMEIVDDLLFGKDRMHA